MSDNFKKSTRSLRSKSRVSFKLPEQENKSYKLFISNKDPQTDYNNSF